MNKELRKNLEDKLLSLGFKYNGNVLSYYPKYKKNIELTDAFHILHIIVIFFDDNINIKGELGWSGVAAELRTYPMSYDDDIEKVLNEAVKGWFEFMEKITIRFGELVMTGI